MQSTITQSHSFFPLATVRLPIWVGGYEPLGVTDDKVVVFSEAHRKVFHLRPTELTERRLQLVLGIEWCERSAKAIQEQADDPSIKPYRELANVLIRACQEEGPYRPVHERRSGIWPDGRGGLFINGRVLWTSGGATLQHGIHDGYAYPLVPDSCCAVGTPEATRAEITGLLDILRGFAWVTRMAPELLLGWTALAAFCAALHRRPHMLITGPAGSGKTTLLDIVGWLLDESAVFFASPPTSAGLRQTLKGRPARAVVIDEFEADERHGASRQILEAARASYSMSEQAGWQVHGTAAGEANSTCLISPFLAAGISPGHMKAADLSRWVLLELGRPRTDAQAVLPTQAEANALGARLIRLFIKRWTSFTKTLAVLHAAILRAGADSRMADTYSHLLAAYWTLVEGRVVDDGSADALVVNLNLEPGTNTHHGHDEGECLNALLTRVVSRCQDPSFH